MPPFSRYQLFPVTEPVYFWKGLSVIGRTGNCVSARTTEKPDHPKRVKILGALRNGSCDNFALAGDPQKSARAPLV